MRPPAIRWLCAVAVFALALAVYLLGIAPGLLWGDSAEMQILAVTGGVSHPSGYPLFVLVGRLFTAIPGGNLAFRANLMSATFAAGTVALLAWLLLRRGASVPATVGAAAAFATTFTIWSTAQRAEVYSLGAFTALAALACTLAALERGGRSLRLAAGFLLGLSVTAYLAYAPLALVAGLALAWRVPRRGRAWAAEEAALLGSFLLGLTPYLYLFWADAPGRGLNYLRLVEIAQWPLGPVPESFRNPFARFGWLLTGRNQYPPVPVELSLRLIAKNVSDTTFLLGLYDIGPVALAAAVLGIASRRRSEPRPTAFLVAVAGACVVFSLLLSGYNILSVFLLPCYIVLAIFAGHGLDEVQARLAHVPGAWRAALVAVALPLGGAAIAHAARVATYDHPLGPFRSRVVEEDIRTQRRLVPSTADAVEPRRFAESAAAAIPESALVISEWREFTPLLYLQRVERRRNDLTIQPSGYPRLLEKVGDWQSRHALERRPVVVVGPLDLMSRHLTSADTIRLDTGRPIVVTRTPLRDLAWDRK